MLKYTGKRLLHLVFILVAVSFLTFLLMYIAPGDAASKKLYAQGVAVSDEVIESMREQLGLNRPFIVQYADWALGALRGDLGRSFRDDIPVAQKLWGSIGCTAVLTLGSLFLALAVSLPLSFVSAIKKDSAADAAVRFLSFVGNSLPNFLISVLLMYFLCVRARILPVVAENSLKGLILPCIALSVPVCARFLRQFRAEILEQISRAYVRGAVARGVKKRYYLFRDVLKNAAGPMLNMTGLSVGTLLGGSVVTETMFRWPGLGKMAMDAITARDYPVIQGFVMFTTVIYVIINLLTDIACHRIDPRLNVR